ncbi:hypothetical protein T190_11880 [Sinorhizobium meliloti CCBAU 01290]|nr:hypothetical protein T190_11880 [Sinorhizobium meliloti CCBAU 01290]
MRLFDEIDDAPTTGEGLGEGETLAISLSPS